MAIKRGKAKATNFTIIDNSMINDNLSWAARGLLTYLISKPEDWEVSTASLVNQTKLTAKKTGRDGVYSLINELIETGYMVRGDRQHDKNGYMGSYDYTVYDSPRTAEPYQAEPDQANTTQVSNELNKEMKVKQISNKDLCKKDLHDEAFDYFWSNMQLRKVNKAKAKSAFKTALNKYGGHREVFASHLINDINDRIKINQFGIDRMHPTTYLNGERWNDEKVIEKQNNNNGFDMSNALNNIASGVDYQQTEIKQIGGDL
jgi:hypothetical protein